MSDAGPTLATIGEQGVIDLFAPPGGAIGEKVVVPNGDDAAAYFVDPRYVSVVTTDSLVEDVHFLTQSAPPVRIGRKLMAVNLSDIAAMGAAPRYALLAVCFPRSTPVALARDIATGVQDMARQHGVAIIGGNVSSSPGPIVLSATLIGRAKPDELVRRRGSQAGDAIFVTGQLGQAKAGLHVMQTVGPLERGDPRGGLVASLTDPQPRVAAGRALARDQLVHAMTDVSDGFASDLAHLLQPEDLGAVIEADALPTSAAFRGYCSARGLSPERMALEGGEDYELLFTAHPREAEAIVAACASVGTPVSRVGTVMPEPTFQARLPGGQLEVLMGGFQHFSE